MPYISFSLKYRPQTFEEIVGQQHVSQTLMNAVATDRVSHAYLFAGPRGTGKTSTARVLAKALNCLSSDKPTPHPCGKCDMCVAIQTGRALDVKEIDAASNRGIDDIRALRETVGYSPAEGRCKVYILDEAHQVTPDAFNALLKTLEEPPDHTYFILATTEPHKVPPTIMSRCQYFDFRTISLRDITEMLKQIVEQEGVEIEEAALGAIAQAGQGAMRDAESILDQIVAYAEGLISLDTVNAVLGVTPAETLAQMADIVVQADLPAAFEAIDGLVSSGKDLGQFLNDLTGYMRDLLRLVSGAEPPQWLGLGEGGLNRMQEQAQALGSERLMEIIHKLAAAREQLRTTSQHVLLLELTLAELCQVPQPPVSEPATAAAAPAPEPKPAPAPAKQPPAAAPAQAPPKPSGPLTLEAIIERWPLVPEELKRMGRMPVGAIVREAQPTALDNNTLTLSLDKQFQFHHSKLNGEYRTVVEEALERLLGQKVRIQCKLGQAEAQAPTAAREAPPAETPAPAPESVAPSDAAQRAVERTLDLFEGSVELEEED